MLNGRWQILLKRVNVYSKDVSDLGLTCLVLYNMCIIFGDTFWRHEWMREATGEVYNSLTIT